MEKSVKEEQQQKKSLVYEKPTPVLQEEITREALKLQGKKEKSLEEKKVYALLYEASKRLSDLGKEKLITSGTRHPEIVCHSERANRVDEPTTSYRATSEENVINNCYNILYNTKESMFASTMQLKAMLAELSLLMEQKKRYGYRR